MSENKKQQYGDPITYSFWDAAEKHQLLIQHCPTCGSYQFYPRPFCVNCGSSGVVWTETKGRATIYSLTTVRVQISPEFHPPYVVAVIQLDEGPRMLTNIESLDPQIGDRIQLSWHERKDAPPIPIWTQIKH